MKIKVDRVVNEKQELVFTITCIDPKIVKFDKINLEVDNETAFTYVKEALEFNIRHELEPMFFPICQEIYNWIYDNQEGRLKRWMEEYDLIRTKYYFANDRTIESDYEEKDNDSNNADD